MVLLACLCSLSACGRRDGGKAQFTPSAGQTAEELQKEADYNAMIDRQSSAGSR